MRKSKYFKRIGAGLLVFMILISFFIIMPALTVDNIAGIVYEKKDIPPQYSAVNKTRTDNGTTMKALGGDNNGSFVDSGPGGGFAGQSGGSVGGGGPSLTSAPTGTQTPESNSTNTTENILPAIGILSEPTISAPEFPTVAVPAMLVVSFAGVLYLIKKKK